MKESKFYKEMTNVCLELMEKPSYKDYVRDIYQSLKDNTYEEFMSKLKQKIGRAPPEAFDEFIDESFVDSSDEESLTFYKDMANHLPFETFFKFTLFPLMDFIENYSFLKLEEEK